MILHRHHPEITALRLPVNSQITKEISLCRLVSTIWYKSRSTWNSIEFLSVVDVFLWTIVLLFLLKSHINLFHLNINLRLIALCAVLIHLGALMYSLYVTYMVKTLHRNYKVADYIEPALNNLLIVIVNIFLFLGSVKVFKIY